MEKLLTHIEQISSFNPEDLRLMEKVFIPVELSAKSIFIHNGKTERFLYFLIEGIVKGYKNNNGKIVVEHLVEEANFITSMDSFFSEVPSKEYFETITDCKLYKISKTDFDLIKHSVEKWNDFIEIVTNENLRCKMERVSDFQTLSAKERYLKFIKRTPNLALNVSVENIASFLGMEPQSLSRIRREIII